MRYGLRAALATVAGNTAGVAAQLVLVVVGLGAVDLATAAEAAPPRSLASLVREGMTVGFTNPKGP